jgi:hypothetical protein
MRMLRTPAVRHVTVSTAGKGSLAPVGSATAPRMLGFTKMMYAMTMKVARPARTSLPTVVPRSRSWKVRSSQPTSPGTARTASANATTSPCSGFLNDRTGRSPPGPILAAAPRPGPGKPGRTFGFAETERAGRPPQQSLWETRCQGSSRARS